MPIHINEENDGKLLVVRVSGKLSKADYDKLAPEFERLFSHQEKLRVLYDMTDFHGWDLGALWEGTLLKIKHHVETSRIERCAMVGETKWQESLAAFCKPFTKTAIRYFDHANSAEARTWLEEP